MVVRQATQFQRVIARPRKAPFGNRAERRSTGRRPCRIGPGMRRHVHDVRLAVTEIVPGLRRCGLVASSVLDRQLASTRGYPWQSRFA